MSFASRLTRAPLAHEPDRAAEAADRFAAQPPEIRALLEGTAGCSPYLWGLMTREADWLEDLLAGAPEPVFAALMDEVRGLSLEALKPGLRQAKRRAALLIALADLGGLWPLEAVTGALTDFADLCVDVTIRRLVAAEIARGRLPGLSEADADTAGGMVALAMGKQGAHELNYSSDIDLICLFDQDRFDPADFHEARSAFVKITRRMTAILSEATGEGYVFRTDLRLRPDASVTPVCMSMEAAERYYESLGRTWERAAHIKARPCAGDIEAGWAYLDRLRPFVWRKHLDFAAIQDAHDMRLRIRSHKGLHGGLVLEGHDMKLGQGGIREIEFFTQTRQIIAGGRDPELRVRGTVEGLTRLAAKGWVPEEVAETLTADYRAHREVEHRLQMVNDAQTHLLPNSAEGIVRIAHFCGAPEAGPWRDALAARLRRVAGLTEGFFAPGKPAEDLPEIPKTAAEIVERWPRYPCLRTTRAQEIFNRLKPDLFSRLTKAPRPAEAFAAFDGFLAGLPAGVQLFSLFEANPHLIDLLIDITSVSPELAQYLSRNARVLDAVIGGSFFEDWPGRAALTGALDDRLGALGDYEAQLDAARAWVREWHFRIGVHFLRGLIDARTAGAEYADLAEAVLAALWPRVVAQFAAKHGDPPGKGAVVLGMGSLGAGALSARSDLDLIVIYDADGVEASEGRRPLASRAYYAKLTQALVTALTAPMAEGRLYEVDMRLRPSGNQGPVATSLQSFRNYQRDEAWTWEHLALTRARPVAGDAALGAEVESFRRALIADKADVARTVAGIVDMRRRLAGAKPAKSTWDGKQGPGRGQDIELIATAAALIAASPATSVAEQMGAGVEAGWLRQDEAEVLGASYRLQRQIQGAAKLISDTPLDAARLGESGQAFLLRGTGAEDVAALEDLLEIQRAAAATAIEAVIARSPAEEQADAD
ncbi:glutamate-ammonia-ligase adenylyltransferase [Rhodovulum sulfidophilum]|uniref:[protein-PII] uridylyltransferase family protein n=1 Tax=Rhodovulum sulfidophilum TaxID=35806 RepID=UPI0005A9B9EB|nr:[glutamate--ammonia-ligase] adenylyltransferase [Rhodovulum sulfidophilum]ANB34767.1 glutamine-synthetase adenylyltransferase [Rhodovulum sulfidophilum DSM 1374]ANB38590.1 glutamine-synthetase adenylyltransferase [Rhodovulum sulfidophilum]MCW2302075.1 glutamate-ammonia-ligase adenylyltransferase [Rhodovulum sulfidophilum]